MPKHMIDLRVVHEGETDATEAPYTVDADTRQTIDLTIEEGTPPYVVPLEVPSFGANEVSSNECKFFLIAATEDCLVRAEGWGSFSNPGLPLGSRSSTWDQSVAYVNRHSHLKVGPLKPYIYHGASARPFFCRKGFTFLEITPEVFPCRVLIEYCKNST